MRSQGWAPGQYLGATDAPQSEFYSAANASHIRAVLKDDNMGLGARRNGGDECTGLNDLQELLGRLNGKSTEALDQERKKREDHRVNMYLHRKLGTVRFVHCGFLVGDKVQELADGLKRDKEEAAAAAAATAASVAETTGAKEGKNDKKSKKRRAEEDDGIIPETKQEKKSKKRRAEDAEDKSKSKRKEKKDKKRREKDESTKEIAVEHDSRKDTESQTEVEDISSRKKSKKDKKDKRKKSKEDEEADTKDASDSQSKKKRRKSEKEEDGTESSKSSALPTQLSTPSASGTATPVSEVPHRHLARKRFIAQKRAAVMDQAALNQVSLSVESCRMRFF